VEAYLKALILGIVEGITEFLPISSTGHLIIVGELLDHNDDNGKLFAVVIQLGAILAVCWEYRERLWNVVKGLPGDSKSMAFAINLLIAFLPAAALGAIFIKQIKATLFNAPSVAMALIVGGVFILWTERRQHTVKIHDIDSMRPMDALKIGLAQTLALIPGVSRAGATIIGGIWFNLDRKVATEFSFFLAIPVMFGATTYDLYKHGGALTLSDVGPFATGFIAAFISAFVAVRGLLRFISRHDFTAFAWYRIVFGVVILATAQLGWVNWAGN